MYKIRNKAQTRTYTVLYTTSCNTRLYLFKLLTPINTCQSKKVKKSITLNYMAY